MITIKNVFSSVNIVRMSEDEHQTIQDMQNKIKNNKGILLYSSEEFNYLDKPLGKALYKNKIGRPKKEDGMKAHPSDILTCDICGGTYKRAHGSDHRKTKIHKAFDGLNNKIKNFILNQ